MVANIQTMFKDGLIVQYTNAKCKWCGKAFFKKHNKQMYCCDHCRSSALKEQKAKYQRKRRKDIRDGVLISNENEYVGTGYLSQHRQEDFDDELAAIHKEMRRFRIRRDY